MTIDVKHFEACEQLFISVGKSYIIEALLDFFQMEDTTKKPILPSSGNLIYHEGEEETRLHFIFALDSFIDKYIMVNESIDPPFGTDGLCMYAVNVIQSFILLSDFTAAVATGNGKHLSLLRKQ